MFNMCNWYVSSTTAQKKQTPSIIFKKTLKYEISVFQKMLLMAFFAADISLQ